LPALPPRRHPAYPPRVGRRITSDASPLRIRPAAPEELPEVLRLLTEAARWWHTVDPEPGSAWPVPFPEDRVRPNLERGEVFLAFAAAGGPAVGTYTLQWSDPEFWGERPPDAGYVHRVAVDRSASGRGIGRALLEDAAERVRGAGRSWLRLDTAASSRPLHRYYTSLGFGEAGSVRVRGIRCVRFEKRLLPPD